MKQMLKKVWNRLICKHEYEYSRSFMMYDGMRKVVAHVCKKCGKEKFYNI